MVTILQIIPLVWISWLIKLVCFDLKKIKKENLELKRSNKEMLKANYRLVQNNKK